MAAHYRCSIKFYLYFYKTKYLEEWFSTFTSKGPVPLLHAFFFFLRKSFILTYRTFAVIFALYNKFWKLNTIMLIILGVHFFSSTHQWHLLVDRKVSNEEWYRSTWLKMTPQIKPVVSLSVVTMSSAKSLWKREEVAFSLIMKKKNTVKHRKTGWLS